jgi:hypothetical protein
MAVSAPVVVLIVYAETLFEPAFATYANSPLLVELKVITESSPAGEMPVSGRHRFEWA